MIKSTLLIRLKPFWYADKLTWPKSNQPGRRSTRHYIGPDDSTSIQARTTQIGPSPTHSARHRPRPARISISQGSNNSTSAWARMTRHWPWPERFDIDPDLNDSTSARARSARHRPKPARLDIGLDLNDSKLSGFARLKIGLGPHVLTSTRPEWLNIGPCLNNSTLAPAWTTQHRPGHERLDNGPGPLGSTSVWNSTTQNCLGPARLDIGLGPLILTSTPARTNQYRPGA